VQRVLEHAVLGQGSYPFVSAPRELGIDMTNSRRALDILGEEMVRTGGNRRAPIPATLARIQQEAGVTPPTATEHLRRMLRAHDDSDLLFCEYPEKLGDCPARLFPLRKVPTLVEEAVTSRG
jgi:hypothetical protein